MRAEQKHWIGFVVTALLLIEILGLIQGIFSIQTIKYELESRIEKSSTNVLHQFRASYEMAHEIQAQLDRLTQGQVDQYLARQYRHIDELITAGLVKDRMINMNESFFHISIVPNTKENLNYFESRYPVKLKSISEYKIVTYELKQSDHILSQTRILVGYTDHKKKLIAIELDEKELIGELEKSQKDLANLLNTSYYFNDKTGNFYVFSGNGRVVYQGGYEKKAEYFIEKDMNSDVRVIDLIQAKRDGSLRVIYPVLSKTKRSMLFCEYDESRDLYFVYEVDELKIYSSIEKVYKSIWLIGAVLVSMTIGLGLLQWYSKNDALEENGLA